MGKFWGYFFVLCSLFAFATEIGAEDLRKSSLALCAQKVQLPAKVSQIFADSFDDVDVYERNQCEKNVARLIDKLKEGGLDVEEAEAWYFTQNFGLPFSETRNFHEWTLHVVLYWRGKILDLDFTRKPEIVNVKDYLHRNIGLPKKESDQEPILKKISLLRVPASRMLEDYPINGSRSELTQFHKEISTDFTSTNLWELWKQIR